MHATMMDYPAQPSPTTWSGRARCSAIARSSPACRTGRCTATATGDFHRRARQLASALARAGLKRGEPGGHHDVEQLSASGGLFRRGLRRRRAAHPQLPAASGRHRLHRQPCRRPLRDRGGCPAAALREGPARDRGRAGVRGGALGRAGAGGLRELRGPARDRATPTTTCPGRRRATPAASATPRAPPAGPKAWSTRTAPWYSIPWRCA